MSAYFGPIRLGFHAPAGFPFQNVTRKSAMRYHDHNIAQGMPLTEWIAYELHKVTLQIQLWAPYTDDPTSVIQALAALRDGRTPLPLFVGNQMVGRGGSLFTLRSMNEHWEVVCGPVIKAKVDLEFSEYSATLSGAQYLGITSSLGGVLGGLSAAAASITGAVGSLAKSVGGMTNMSLNQGSIGGIVATAANVGSSLAGAVSSISGIGASISNFASGVSAGIANPTKLAATLTSGGVTGISGSLPAASSAVSGMASTLSGAVNQAGGTMTVIKSAMSRFRPLF
jgi:phage protein U